MSTFFFFQAEDGIRDGHVTGVQTCALPISRDGEHDVGERALARDLVAWATPRRPLVDHPLRASGVCWSGVGPRSEERRVGKECRSRRRADRERKKTQSQRYDRMQSGLAIVV